MTHPPSLGSRTNAKSRSRWRAPAPRPEILDEAFESAGAYVMGRRMADGGDVPWGDEPPFHAPVFVVTYRARETLERKGGTSFTYVTDGLDSAIDPSWRDPSRPSSRFRRDRSPITTG